MTLGLGWSLAFNLRGSTLGAFAGFVLLMIKFEFKATGNTYIKKNHLYAIQVVLMSHQADRGPLALRAKS